MKTLSDSEARVVYELALVEGRPLDIFALAVAAGQPAEAFDEFAPNHNAPRACDRTYAVIGRILKKFGPVIESVGEDSGFRLAPGALGPRGWLDVAR